MSEYSYATLNASVATGFNYRAWWHPHAEKQGLTPLVFAGGIPNDTVTTIITEDLCEEPLTGSMTLDRVDGYKRIYNAKTGRTLQVAGAGYTIHLPAVWCAEAAMPLIEAAKAEGMGVISVCSLGDGKYSSVSLAYPETRTIADMEIAPYTSFSTGGGGDFASQVNNGTTVTVCDNTIQIARTQSTASKVRHTANSASRLQSFIDSALALHDYTQVVSDRIEMLAATMMTEADWSRLIEALLPKSDTGRGETMRANKEASLRHLADFDVRCQPWKGTALGAFQTFNTWQQHTQTVQRGARAERNMTLAVTGQQANVDAKVLEAISLITNKKELVIV